MTVQTVGFLSDPNVPRQQGQIAQLAQSYLGTGALPQIQRSEMLAQALQNMQAHGGDNIQSPLALGSNLLAEALLQYGSRRANKGLLDQISQSQAKSLAGAMTGTGYGDPQTPAQPPAGSSPAGLTPPAPTPPVASAGGPLASASPANPRDQMLAALIAGGMNPPGAQGLVGNFAQESGPNLNRDNPSEGAIGAANWRGPRAQAAQAYFAAHGGPSIQNQADFALSELHGPEAKAFARLQAATDPASGAAAGLAYERPAGYTPNGDPAAASGWPNRLAQAQGMAGGPQIAAAQGAPPQPGNPPAQPYQIASAGQTPPPPSQGAPPPPPQGMPPPQMPQQPQAPQGPPTGPQATPQEQALIRQYLSYPQGSGPWLQGYAMLQDIQKRASTPQAPPKDMMWGPGGRAMPVPGTEFQNVQGAPNEHLQQDPFGKLNSVADPSFGAVPAGSHLGPGGLSQLPVQQAQTFKIPGANGIFTTGPDGRPVKVADDSFTPKDLGDRLTKIQGSDQAKALDNATNMYNAAVQASQRSGGISDVELRDFAARQFSGGVARQFNVEALNNAQGPWQHLKQFIPELVSGQKMSPQARQAVLQAMHDDAIQATNAFQHYGASDEAFAQSQGMSLKPFLAPLYRPLAEMPDISAIPNGAGGLQGGNGAPVHGAVAPSLDNWVHPGRAGQVAPQTQGLPTPEQAAAELARRRAARGHQ